MTKLFVSGTEGRAYQEFRGRDLKGHKLEVGVYIGRKDYFSLGNCLLIK